MSCSHVPGINEGEDQPAYFHYLLQSIRLGVVSFESHGSGVPVRRPLL